MNLSKHEYYFNRELSWLGFNERVLLEAQDNNNLVLERLKFLAITASNLDEFFMIRVSSLLQLDALELEKKDPSGLTPKGQLDQICVKAHEMVNAQYNCLNHSIMPRLNKENIYFVGYKTLTIPQKEFLKHYFMNTVFPILTPMAIDPFRPFPLLNNKTLIFVVELEDEDSEEESKYAVMQVPTVIPRIIALPTEPSRNRREFILLEKVIYQNLPEIFLGHKVLDASIFRITRDADLEIDEEDARDVLNEIVESVKRRKWGEPVRLEIEQDMGENMRRFLIKNLEMEQEDIYEINGPIDLTVFMGFSSMPGLEHLRNIPVPPVMPVEFTQDGDYFAPIREKDILVHHPYEAFDCVIGFVKAAAKDSNVLAIKQTLYRVSGNSPIVNALISAAENGKQVTVLVELKARFDEENNIIWAKKLEKAGCHVVYGLVGLKTHCKMCLVVRKENDVIRRYVHLGTGNYNDSTAKLYTDFGFFTCSEKFGEDVSALFNMLTGYSSYKSFNKLYVAPLNLRKAFIHLIDEETKNAKQGKPAKIIAKMNSLVDVEIIKALYNASIAGVDIKLIVRGACCLRSRIPGVSENIQVMSLVDRYLEHSRIFYFEADGEQKIYLSSADWMPRNLDRRVEIIFPVESPDLKAQLKEALKIVLKDTKKIRVQQNDGTYKKKTVKKKSQFHSQLEFHKIAQLDADIPREEHSNNLFIPIYKE